MGPTRTRAYKDTFLELGFTYVVDKDAEKPQCVICGKVLAASTMKRNLLERHLHSEHQQYKGKDLDFFQRKLENLNSRKFDAGGRLSKMNESLILASYHVAYRVAKAKKAHTIAENLIKPCTQDITRIVLGAEQAKKLDAVPLSNNTIQRRISDISDDILSKVVKEIKNSKYFCIACDESTDVASLSQLLVFVRYINNGDFKDEILFCKPLELTTRGIDVFNLINQFMEDHSIDWKKCISSTTDGAPAMLGKHSGFQAKVKQVSGAATIHCMLHREALCAKTLPETLKDTLNDAIKMVNLIKASALNTRLFRQLCKDMDADHLNLLYHTEVRWLSKGNMLLRVYELREEVQAFLRSKKSALADRFDDLQWLCDLCYLTDIFERLNILNRSLQGNNANVMDYHDKLAGFMSTLDLLVQKVEVKRFALFPRTAEFFELNELENTQTLEKISGHLKQLKKEFENWFPELDTSQFLVTRDPFSAKADLLEDDFAEEELVRLKADTSARDRFSTTNLNTFWCVIEAEGEYPILADLAIRKLVPLPSTYCCESAFSAMTVIKNKYRNRLSLDIEMRVSLAVTEPNLDALASKMQHQPSH